MGDRRFDLDDPRFLAFQAAVLAAERADRAGRKARAAELEEEADRARRGLTRAVKQHEASSGPRTERERRR